MDGGGTTTGTWEVESCRERRPRAASGDPQGCGEVEQRMEQLPEQRPRSSKRPGTWKYRSRVRHKGWRKQFQKISDTDDRMFASIFR
jgi:hypothetical protein